ncbi:MAG: cysteine desulfurase [Bacteroidales bacterium]|nr:cysteine desulfurase [Bacteroidales bacterium]
MNIREQFPILKITANGKPLVYFDNGATTQKPQCVIDRIVKYYTEENSNIHRGTHYLSELSTQAFEHSRDTVAKFINAGKREEIVFTKGTTDSINLVADTFSTKYLAEGDEVIVTQLEHHSNIVPWQIACEKKGAVLKVLPITEKGDLMVEKLPELMTDRTRIIAVAHVSNVLGTINPVKDIVAIAHSRGIPVLVDGAQGIPHVKVDVQEFDCDFYCFSGHKMYAPMGVGVLYGKEKWLNDLPPYQGGGEMIGTVTFARTTYNDLPYKFEAGTPNVEAVLGLETAIDFMDNIGYDAIMQHENELLKYCTEELKKIDGVRIYGESEFKSGVISFLINGIHPFDVGTLLDKISGVAVRTGHHCAEPLMDFYGILGTVRASFAVYNTLEEVDVFISGLKKVVMML